MGLCVFSLPISLAIIMKMFFILIIIIKSEVWIIIHCLRLSYEAMVDLWAVYSSGFSNNFRQQVVSLPWSMLNC